MHNAYFQKAISRITLSKSSDQKYQFFPHSNNFNIINKEFLPKKSSKNPPKKFFKKKKILQKIPKKIQKIPERCLGGNFVSLEVW